MISGTSVLAAEIGQLRTRLAHLEAELDALKVELDISDGTRDKMRPALLEAQNIVKLAQEWKRVVEGFQDGTQDLAQLDVRLEQAEKALFAALPDAEQE